MKQRFFSKIENNQNKKQQNKSKPFHCVTVSILCLFSAQTERHSLCEVLSNTNKESFVSEFSSSFSFVSVRTKTATLESILRPQAPLLATIWQTKEN
jgi:hypothetical protein